MNEPSGGQSSCPAGIATAAAGTTMETNPNNTAKTRNPVIILTAMRHLIPLMAIVIFSTATALAQTIPPTADTSECAVIPAPSRVELEPWLAGSAWRDALRFYTKDLYDKAYMSFSATWVRLRGELEKAFAGRGCDYDEVNSTLNARVFKAPPDIIPHDEEFGMPVPVALAASDAACRAGDVAKSLDWLEPAAVSGNVSALAALVVLESKRSPETALARITRSDTITPELALAGCIASMRAGDIRKDWCAKLDMAADSRQGLELVRIARELIETVPASNGEAR